MLPEARRLRARYGLVVGLAFVTPVPPAVPRALVDPGRAHWFLGVTPAGGLARVGLEKAAAEGLLYQLPPDGSWVQFDVAYTFHMAGQEQRGKQTFRMASVGTVRENGDEHRWIEFKIVESEWFWIRKLLIPVRYLKRGENPTLHVVRGWTLQENRGVEPAEPIHGRWPAYLAGRLHDEKPLVPEVVDTKKLGPLKSEGVTGWIDFSEGKLYTKVTYHTRLHPTAPFGVIANRTLFECTGEGQSYTIDGRMTLTDLGTGAKTELPDHR